MKVLSLLQIGEQNRENSEALEAFIQKIRYFATSMNQIKLFQDCETNHCRGHVEKRAHPHGGDSGDAPGPSCPA